MAKILYFGVAQEITGLPGEEMTAPDTVSLRKSLISRYPEMGRLAFRIAVNAALVRDEKQLGDGDTVAILPPFQGG